MSREHVLSVAGATNLQGLFANGSEIITGQFAEVNPENPARQEVLGEGCARTSTDHPELFSHGASVPVCVVVRGTKELAAA